MIDFALNSSTAPVQTQLLYKAPSFEKPPNIDNIFNLFPSLSSRTTTSPVQLNSTTFMVLDLTGQSEIFRVPIPAIKKFDPLAVSKPSTIQKINSIKEKLSLSITQLAELLNVTRKAVYDWYEGAEPTKKSIVSRINVLYSLENYIHSEIDITRLKTCWKIPLSERSFLSILNNEELGEEELRLALIEKINELSARMATTDAPKIRLSKGLPTSQLSDIERSANFS